MKRKDILTASAMWVDLEDVMLSEIHRHRTHTIGHHSQEVPRVIRVGWWAPGTGMGRGVSVEWSQSLSLGRWKVGTAGQPCECAQSH
jgi:hypothetical protein